MAELNITNIPAPRVPFIDERTGLMAREWYRFFLNMFVLTGSGSNATTLDELQIGPPVPTSSGTVTSVTGTPPVVSSGGNAPVISMPAATASANGYLTSTDWNTFNNKGVGTVTSVSVVSANGLAGTVATATTTPAVTLSTTVTGVLKGNGTAISAATSGTDYAPATSGTSILYGSGAGGFNNVTIGTGVAFAGGTLSATGSGGTVTSVTGTAPVVSSGGATPAISMAAATTSVNGYLTSTDWNTFNGKGSVTSVAQSFTGGLISVSGSPITTSGTLALTVAGTSGGVPYFTTASTWATSAALAANALVIGGGAGAAPATTTTGTGVVTALGVNTGSAGAVVLFNGALGTPSSGTATNLTGLPLTTGVTGTLAAANGGTGITAVGASGNVLTSNGTAWTSATPASAGVPAGTILEYGGTSAPTGYLGCDGAAVSRSTYATLFTAISTTWGVGDGTTTFNVPDFRRRVPVGSGGTGTATLANSVGSTGGVEGFTLTGAQLPQYTAAIGGGTGFADTGTLIGNTVPYSLFYASGAPSAIPIIQPSAVVLKIIKI
jgi:microcystin-dependent protein